MKWPKFLTPFRIAVVLVLLYQLAVAISSASPHNGGGSAWGGVAYIALLFWGLVMWLVDVLMRKLIPDHRVVIVIEFLVLLAMYLFLDW